jgi:hypothetical protein
MLLSDAADKFLRVLRIGEYKPHTISNYDRDLRQFREHATEMIGHEPDATEITRDLINKRLAELARRPCGYRGTTRSQEPEYHGAVYARQHGLPEGAARARIPAVVIRAALGSQGLASSDAGPFLFVAPDCPKG